MTIRVVYHAGSFVPEESCEIPEGAHGVVVVEQKAKAMDEQRRAILHQLAEDMKNQPLPSGSPHFSRSQMHERG